jgi:acyl-CoA thioester hydrolase
LIFWKYCRKAKVKESQKSLIKMMKEHTVQVRVRYSETDQMGVVYHGNYLPFFEIGRVEWLRSQGISYKELEASGIGLPIVNLTLNFKKPARYDDLLTIVTRVKSQQTVKIDFECEIWNESKELLTTAYFLLVFVDVNTGRPILPPKHISEILESLQLDNQSS